jgi:peptidyl-prolyl cis-trans isomerase SurA
MESVVKQASKVLVLGALVAAGAAWAELVDKVAAVVNEQVIPLSEVEKRAAPELAAASRKPGAERAEARKKALQNALDGLIGEKLMEKEIEDLGISVTDQEVDLGIEDVRKQNNFEPEQFEQALKSEGYSLPEYREFMRKHLRRLKLVNLKVRSRVQLSEKDLRTAYENWARLEKGDPEIHARHILVKLAPDAPKEEVARAEVKAKALAAEAKKPGVDFAELARKKSEGPSRDDGGDLGTFRRGTMLAEFEKVAFNLPEGGVSDPIRTRFGIHIVKVESRKEIPVKSFEEMKPQLQEKLGRDQLEKFTEQYVRELRQAAAIEVRI